MTHLLKNVGNLLKENLKRMLFHKHNPAETKKVFKKERNQEVHPIEKIIFRIMITLLNLPSIILMLGSN